MAWKRGYLCDVQGEVQVAYQPASGLYLLLSSSLLGEAYETPLCSTFRA